MAKKKVKKSSSKFESKSLEAKPDSNSSQLAPKNISTIKICRLCEAKDGPFINIFDTEQTIHKKIEMLLPFSITENDGLPHYVCFRCSAKVEDTFEFVQKCIRAQTNLCKMFGKDAQVIPDSKDPKKLWEKKLVQSNMSNEDVCDAVVKRAMEGIPGIILSPEPGPLTNIEVLPLRSKRKTRNVNENVYKEETISSETFTHIKQYNSDQPKRKTRSNPILESRLSELSKLNAELHDTIEVINKPEEEPKPSSDKKPTETSSNINNFSFDYDDNVQPKVKSRTKSSKKNTSKEPVNEDKYKSNDVIDIPDEDDKEEKKRPEPVSTIEKQTTPPKKDPNFNIMDHVSMIKVNGVGVLFQCGLCNRNFLKKDVLQNHGCAKTGVAKPDFNSIKPVLDTPKNPMASVKFLTNKPAEQKNDPVEVEKPKPKIGPASKIKKITPENMIGMKITPTPETTQVPSNQKNQFKPGTNLFKLVPGPNNSYTLVQDTQTDKRNLIQLGNTIPDSDSEPEIVPISKPGPKSKVRKFTRPKSETPPQPTQPQPISQPYPVGLFAVNSNSEEIITPIQQPMNFGAQYQNPMPNQVYSQLQQHLFAGQMPQQHYQQMQMPQQYGHEMHPQHLNQMLQQQNMQQQNMQQQNMQQQNMQKQNMQQQNMQQHLLPNQYQPVSVAERPVTFTTPAMKKQSYTVVQTGHPSKLLISTRPRPNLPHTEIQDTSNNIIQESQISTSAPIEYPYKCHMCPISFSRDKKLQAHLQGHYSKLEDNTDVPKKRVRRA